MNEAMIGMASPVIALIIYAIVYQPFLTWVFPQAGWLGLASSPQIFFLLASLAILWVKKLSFQNVGFSRENLGKNVFLGFVLGLVPVTATLVIGGLLTGIDYFAPFLPRPIFGGVPLYFNITLKSLFVLLIFAPLSEELFFRGILLKSLLERHSTWIAIIFSALIFMAGHGKIAPGPLALGLIAGWLTVMTRSIVPGIVFHSIANAYGPILVTWFPNLYRYLEVFYA